MQNDVIEFQCNFAVYFHSLFNNLLEFFNKISINNFSMVIAITNLKGGVGKTTLTVNLAVEFAKRGKRVCIVDTDLGQKSAMEWAGNREEKRVKVPVYGVTVKQLTKEVAELAKGYDLVLIDGTPQLNEIADRTIIASDIVLIPLAASMFDFRGFENFLERYVQMKEMKEANNGNVRAFIVLNRIDKNRNITKQIEGELSNYELPVLENKVSYRVAYVESAIEGLGVVEFRDSKAKAEIEGLVSELETLF
jgi:chromosome partitioning protein